LEKKLKAIVVHKGAQKRFIRERDTDECNGGDELP